MIETLLQALQMVFSFWGLLMIFLGAGVGIIVGALPGVGPSATIAMALPMTFGKPPELGLMFMGGVYAGALSGGSIAAILINTPGDASAVATTLDGYPLHKKGRTVYAIGLSAVGSMIGGQFGNLCLLLIAPILSVFALKFRAPEMFLLAILGLSVISVVSKGDMIKGLLPAAMGFFISTVGFDNLTGHQRFTFGISEMSDGIPYLSVLIGLFAISEAISLVEKKDEVHVVEESQFGSPVSEYFQSFWDTIRKVKLWVQSSIIGVVIGIIPGAGASICSIIAYTVAMQQSSHPETFGKGEPDGVIAPETANNAIMGGALIPALTLGIPGNAATAVLLGALMIHGMQPGPALFEKHGAIVYAFIFSLFVASVAFWILTFAGVKYYAKMVGIKNHILAPIIIVLSIIGAYGIHNSIFAAIVAVIFGIIGYFMQRYGFSVLTMVLGLILGPIAEVGFRTSLILSKGSYLIFVTRPISLVMIGLIILIFMYPFIQNKLKKNKGI